MHFIDCELRSSNLFKTTLAYVFELYACARIPIVSKMSTWYQMVALFKQYRNVIIKAGAFELNGSLMIWACKCDVDLGLPCSYDQQKRVPLDVQDFFVGQCRVLLLTLDSLPVPADVYVPKDDVPILISARVCSTAK